MTKLLEQAISRLKTLPTTQQDTIAAMILEEIEDEVKWDETFAKSQDVLAQLAADAMAEYKAGKTQELDPETFKGVGSETVEFYILNSRRLP